MLLDRYLDHLTYEKRCSAHTVAAYRRDLERFQAFLDEVGGGALEQVSDRMVRAWMMRLMEQGVSARSVNRKLSALRGFFRFARMTGSVQADPTALIDPPRTPKRLPEFVGATSMARLFDEYTWPDGYTGHLHRLVLELFYTTGMRLAEMLGLEVGDADLSAATLRVLGKRNKERLIPLAPGMVDRILEHLEMRRAQAGTLAINAPLLADQEGRQLARRSVQRLVSHYLGGVTPQQRKSPHVLRHTFATHMLENGADLNAVKELLGHAGLAATQVYTHNTVEKLRNVHAKAHPRGGQ